MDSRPEQGNGSDGKRWGTAASVMRRVESHVRPGDTLSRAAERMEAAAVRELPVVEEGRLVGLIAQIDLLPYRGHFEWTPVRAAMSRDLVTVSAETPLPEVAAVLIERGINCVPVVEGERLVGMVSRSDCLRPLAWHAFSDGGHDGRNAAFDGTGSSPGHGHGAG